MYVTSGNEANVLVCAYAHVIVTFEPKIHSTSSALLRLPTRIAAESPRARMSRLDYSKWDHIEVSDDEDDTHPNIDTASLFRWRHQARVERMDQHQQEMAKFLSDSQDHKRKMVEVKEQMKKEVQGSGKSDDRQLQEKLKELEKEEQELQQKKEELSKEERLTPWNVDTLSKPGFEKTVINVPKEKKKELSEEDKHEKLVSFIDKHGDEIKHFGMLSSYDDSRDYLRDHPYLVCVDTASYLTMWCVNLQVQDKSALVERIAHQTIIMQYILELARQLQRDPRSCVPGFFVRMKSGERTYMDAFEDEVRSFVERVKGRAEARIEEATRTAEEEEKQKRLGPGGLDPVEVMETLPAELKECFESKSIAKLQEVLAEMPKEEAVYHMKRCTDSGLWVPDAKAAGLTPAKEELKKLKDEGKLKLSEEEVGLEPEEEEEYETLDDDEDLGLD